MSQTIASSGTCYVRSTLSSWKSAWHAILLGPSLAALTAFRALAGGLACPSSVLASGIRERTLIGKPCAKQHLLYVRSAPSLRKSGWYGGIFGPLVRVLYLPCGLLMRAFDMTGIHMMPLSVQMCASIYIYTYKLIAREFFKVQDPPPALGDQAPGRPDGAGD